MTGATDMEQDRHGRSPGGGRGWLILLAACTCLIAWGLAIHVTVRDAPRQWDFGALPDVPGESIYSIQASPAPAAGGGAPPRVMAPLPESVPLTTTAPARPGAAAPRVMAPLPGSAPLTTTAPARPGPTAPPVVAPPPTTAPGAATPPAPPATRRARP